MRACLFIQQLKLPNLRTNFAIYALMLFYAYDNGVNIEKHFQLPLFPAELGN